MRPTLRGTVALPVESGAPFDPGRFLSILALRLQQSGASVSRHASTVRFEHLRLWNARRTLAYCSGTGELLEDAQGPRFRYSLQFTEAAWMTAAVCGLAVAYYLWQYESWTVLRCMSPAVLTMLWVQGAEALVLMLWLRHAARRTARAVTYRAPRAAA